MGGGEFPDAAGFLVGLGAFVVALAEGLGGGVAAEVDVEEFGLGVAVEVYGGADGLGGDVAGERAGVERGGF